MTEHFTPPSSFPVINTFSYQSLSCSRTPFVLTENIAAITSVKLGGSGVGNAMEKKGEQLNIFSSNHFISLNTLSGYLGIKERKYLHTNYISVYLIKLLCGPGTQKCLS